MRTGGNNVRIINGKNITNSQSYFNMVSLTKRIVMENQTKPNNNKTIYFSEKSSIIQALQNSRSNEWRIIKLRNNINERKWTIKSLNIEYYKTFKKNSEVTMKLSPIQPIKLKTPNYEDYIYLLELNKITEENIY